MDKIAIAITDDDALIVSLLQGYLDGRNGIEVLFTAGSGEELLDILSKAVHLPEVLLLDLKMSGIDGVAVTENIKTNYPDIKVIVISSHYQKTFMGFMLKTGVSAFLPKGISPVELVDIISVVSKQGYYFREDQMDALREQIPAKAPRPALNDDSISEREVEVLRLICQQKTAKEIGDMLNVAQRTVEGHKNNLFAKTGAKNIAGLVIYAIQNQIIDANELPVF
ncbi:MAG: response regulator transcription factor [Flavobacterium sp.]|nr:MAG: response regulator transcription factor [Flavobacterium sp.]